MLTAPTVAETRLSPDKHWVAFNWYRMHENVDVFLVPSDGSQPPTPLTYTPEVTEIVSWTPINYVQDIRGKLLIVQGALDPDVSPENVRQVRDRLESHSIPYTLLIFEDEGHGIGKPANQELLYPQLADFFERALAR